MNATYKLIQNSKVEHLQQKLSTNGVATEVVSKRLCECVCVCVALEGRSEHLGRMDSGDPETDLVKVAFRHLTHSLPISTHPPPHMSSRGSHTHTHTHTHTSLSELSRCQANVVFCVKSTIKGGVWTALARHATANRLADIMYTWHLCWAAML